MFVPTTSESSRERNRLPELKFINNPKKRSTFATSSEDFAESSNNILGNLEGKCSSPPSTKRPKLDQEDNDSKFSEKELETKEGIKHNDESNQESDDLFSTSIKSKPEPKIFKALQVTKPSFISKYKVEGIPNVYYQKDWIDSKTSKKWLKEIESLSEWYRPTLKVYGKEIQQSREIAAFSTEPNLPLKYSGHETIMHSPFPKVLQKIANKLSSEDCLGEEVEFNHVMLNKYKDGSINIGKHSDNLENKVIVTISLGAERSWIMERKPTRKSSKKTFSNSNSNSNFSNDDEMDLVEKKRWKLSNGSLLVMQGDTQKDWKHEIPKELKVKDMRISITFRQLVY